MKKLMIVAAIALAAVTSQAASVAWKLDQDATRSYAYNTVYMINAANSAAVVALLNAGGANIADALADYNINSAGAKVLTYKGVGNGTSTDTAKAGDSYMWLVVQTGNGESVKDGLGYKMTGAISYETLAAADAIGEGATPGTDYVLVKKAGANPATDPAIDLFTGASGTIGSAIPEPTSGLLLLLGVAGLALRRRRA